MIRHFDLEKESIQQDRTIRPSKFHTSIQFMDDGRLILQTHTTSPAPSHPTWMPEGYLNHQWESFQGSEVFIYDPDKKLVQGKGIMAPFCTLYGGGLSNKGRLYFGLGCFNGYGYIYDLETNESVCIGQVTDGRSNRLYEGPDGNIYYGTASGHLSRLNVNTRKIEILAEIREKAPLRHGAFDRDGVFWFSAWDGMSLYSYDYRTNVCREEGRFFEDGEIAPGWRKCYGFDFDDLLDMARIDGVSEFGIYFRMVLPMLVGSVGALSIFAFMQSWGAFIWPLIITSNRNWWTMELGLGMFQYRYSVELGPINAGSVLSIIPVLIVFLILRRRIVEGITLSGMKE
jgi:hypothetical protein